MMNPNRGVATSMPHLRRRSLLALGIVAVVPLSRRSFADPAAFEATATIMRFNDALLALMQTGAQTTFSRRFDLIAPSVDQTFDLRTVLAVSVGASWTAFHRSSKTDCWPNSAATRWPVTWPISTTSPASALPSCPIYADLMQDGSSYRRASYRLTATQQGLIT